MEIAILTSGILPVPATQGGAVEALIDHYINRNALTGEHEFTVFSVAPPTGTPRPTLPHTSYVHVPTATPWARMRRKLRSWLSAPGFYNYFINDFYLTCRQRLLRRRWDAIVLENRPGYAIDLRRHYDGPIILHQHLDSVNADTPRGDDICRALTHAIGVSDYICRRMAQVGTPLPTTTVYNGIDTERFARAATARRSDFGLSPGDFVVAYCGRIDPIKGVAELIDAMVQLRDMGNLHLLVVGGSFYGNAAGCDTPFIEALKTAAKPIRERIHFTGFVPYERVPSLLKMADLAVMPSTCQEAFQLTVVEAMAAGVPVVATRSGGVPEICEGVACIVDHGEHLAQRLAKAIATLAADPQERRAMSARGLMRAQRFAHTAYADAFLHALTSILRPKTK
ncbi:MAG: glycosyltransferase family 4 protein [Bacteroidaceae bacterium]|nr:glycosyltransferase family 4 protein [Bacteroidaceae bacterium]